MIAHVPADGGAVTDGQVIAQVDDAAVSDAAVRPDAAVRIVVQSRDAGVLAPPPANDAGTSVVVVAPKKPVTRDRDDEAGHRAPLRRRPLPRLRRRDARGGVRDALRGRVPRAGYKPGKVEVVFDGTTEVTLCAMQRIKICIDNIKNPFDDCEVDPTRPSPDPSVNNLQQP